MSHAAWATLGLIVVSVLSFCVGWAMRSFHEAGQFIADEQERAADAERERLRVQTRDANLVGDNPKVPLRVVGK